jgi:hypothetical protein
LRQRRQAERVHGGEEAAQHEHGEAEGRRRQSPAAKCRHHQHAAEGERAGLEAQQRQHDQGGDPPGFHPAPMAEPHQTEQGGEAEGHLRRMFQPAHGQADQIEAKRQRRRHQRQIGRCHGPQPDAAFGGDQAK